jgi:hypothetical protein
MDRKLASIQRIVSLEPIKDADKILKATVLGWELVVAKKDNFNVGDLCVYCEVDSILPAKPEFEFLRERKFRIKTIKLKGQVSQGICFPLSILPYNPMKYSEGRDVTDILGVIKYDPQAEFERKETLRLASIDKNRMTKFLKRYSWFRRLFFKPARIPFPAFIRKTDEDRIQLFPNFYEKWGHLRFDITEKIDGQSVTYFMIRNPNRSLWNKKWVFGVCSRNFQLLKPDNSSYWTIAKQCCIEAKMRHWSEEHGKGLIIQGEAVGKGIQGNKYNIDGYSLFVFNIAAYYKGQTVEFSQPSQVAICQELSLCPVVWLFTNFSLKPTIPEMVNMAVGASRLNYRTPREGVVVRNYDENISFKVINPEFLLQYAE